MQSSGQQPQPPNEGGRQSNASLSQRSNASRTPTRQKKGAKMGTLSISSRQGQAKPMQRQFTKDEMISRKIQEIFKKRELDMTKIIKQTIFDDRFLYKKNRKEFEGKMQDLEKEKLKINRRRKNKKEKMKALKANTIERLKIVCAAIRQTYMFYRKNFYESDHYRHIKLMEIQIAEKSQLAHSKSAKKKSRKELKNSDQADDQNQGMAISKSISGELSKQSESADSLKKSSDVTSGKKASLFVYSGKKFCNQLQNFFESPFKEDKRFALQYLAFLTRDKIVESEDTVNKLFQKNVLQNILLKQTKDKDEIRLKKQAFDIVSNMVQSKNHRQRLASYDHFSLIFDRMSYLVDSKDQQDQEILEKLSWLATLISFHEDMFDQIIKINLLQFVIKISDQSFPNSIRSNAVLAISLLTYNSKLFDQIINQGVIDLVMQLCRDKNQDVVVKQFSTLALVHFALNPKSIKILIEKGVLNLFDTFGNSDTDSNNEVIQTNVAWIFLALCNNNITGKQMLEQGITRDMFLVSCNPNYQQIRHLVITGFAQLGHSIDSLKQSEVYSSTQQKIKEMAVVGMHDHILSDAQANIDLLIMFTTSDDIKHQITSYRALKDYVLLRHGNLVPDITKIITAFIIGCLSDEQIIQGECADGLSYIVTHHLVYGSYFNPNISSGQISMVESMEAEKIIEQLKSMPVEYVLDAIMYLSGSESKQIRTTAFSTLSSMSKYSSQCESVMVQIQRDIQIPSPLTSKDYLEFLQKRLSEQRDIFHNQFKNTQVENDFKGLYSLLRLAQEPSLQEIEEATDSYVEFIQHHYDCNNENNKQNERYFIKVFLALKHTQDPSILKKMLQVIRYYIDQKDSPLQKEIISPHTILWMLEIMEHQRDQKLLCCLTSSTLLNIVSKHEIHFDYQEVAIIKKFNLALKNIDVFAQNSHDEQSLVDSQEINKEDSFRMGGQDTNAQNSARELAKSQMRAQTSQLLKEEGHTTQIPDLGTTRLQDDEQQAENQCQKNEDSIDKLKIAVEYQNLNIESQSHLSQKLNDEISNKIQEAKNELDQLIELEYSQKDAPKIESIRGHIEKSIEDDHSQLKAKTMNNSEVDSQNKKDGDSLNKDNSQKHPHQKQNSMNNYNFNPGQRSLLNQNSQDFGSMVDESKQNQGIIESTFQRKNERENQKVSSDQLQGSMDDQLKVEQQIYENVIDQKYVAFKLKDPAYDRFIKETSQSKNASESFSQKDNIQLKQKQLADQLEQNISDQLNYAQNINQSRENNRSHDRNQSNQTEKQGNQDYQVRSQQTNKSIGGSKNQTNFFKKRVDSNVEMQMKRPSLNKVSHWEKRRESIDTEKLEYVDIENIQPSDSETIENVLRDSLIKAFMVIFTNDQSQHLLLNKDLIDIAFNCLEFCSDITLAAKRHVAKLISIIFKFPQVQKRLMAKEVVQGICELLKQVKHTDIIQFTIKACTYISMNYGFIAKPEFSLDILKSLINLVHKISQTLTNKELEYNTMLTIQNILSGDKQNKMYFWEQGGTSQLFDIILQSHDFRMVDLCIGAIAEQAKYKKVVLKMLVDLKATQQMVMVIAKCLEISDNWNCEKCDINQINDQQLNKVAVSHPQLLEIHSRLVAQDSSMFEIAGTKLAEMNAIQDISQSQNIFENKKGLDDGDESSQTAECNKVQIPEFMKNDLEQLNASQKQILIGGQLDQRPVMRKQGRIRESVYYIIARIIRFGDDISHLLQETNLIKRLIKDLQMIFENQVLFQNIMLVCSNLTTSKSENALDAIVSLLENNYQVMIDKIFQMNDKDARVALLKGLIQLILKAADQVADCTGLFCSIFQVALDPLSDDTITENIIWFATSLCQDSVFHQNFSMIIQNILKSNVIEIIAIQLQSKNERIILQTLKLISKLADLPEFRNQLFQCSDILVQLQQLTDEIEQIQKFQLEIKTLLCTCLDRITRINETDLDTNYQTQQQQDQLKGFKIFNRYLIQQALTLSYSLRRLDDTDNMEEQMDFVDHRGMFGIEGPNQSPMKASNRDDQHLLSQNDVESSAVKQSFGNQDSSYSFLKDLRDKQTGLSNMMLLVNPTAYSITEKPEELNDIDMFQNNNQLVENLVGTIDNLASDSSIHQELVENGVVDVIGRFIQMFVSSAKEQNTLGINEIQDGIDLSVMPTGSLKLIKSVASLMMKLSQQPQIQMQCLNLGMLDMLQTSIESLQDYEVLTWLYIAIGNYAVCGLINDENAYIHQNNSEYANICAEIRSKATNFGCIQLLIYGSEISQFFRIRRICNEYLALLQ